MPIIKGSPEPTDADRALANERQGQTTRLAEVQVAPDYVAIGDAAPEEAAAPEVRRSVRGR